MVIYYFNNAGLLTKITRFFKRIIKNIKYRAYMTFQTFFAITPHEILMSRISSIFLQIPNFMLLYNKNYEFMINV